MIKFILSHKTTEIFYEDYFFIMGVAVIICERKSNPWNANKQK